jgi:hypothetical protein
MGFERHPLIGMRGVDDYRNLVDHEVLKRADVRTIGHRMVVFSYFAREHHGYKQPVVDSLPRDAIL